MTGGVGGNVYVETTGSGPDLTLLHGWGLNVAVGDGVRDALAADLD
jgi:hypothetical protein